jgi:hypothetical protein
MFRRTFAVIALASSVTVTMAQTPKIYWGDDVPAGWTGRPDADLLTVPERTKFTRTTSTLQLHEWIAALKHKSENVHVVSLFTSPMRRVSPAIVLGSPRVTSPQQARQSGKPVVFLLGNIHPPEPEAAEALLMVARDLATGKRPGILDKLIVMVAPIYNVDGTDTFVAQDGSLGSETPEILGVRENSNGLDLNRDAVKVTEVETLGLYKAFADWDPLLMLDGHLMSRVTHGYANTYGTTTVPAAAPGPRDYMHDTLFPAVRDKVRADFGLEVFSHALPVPNAFPPTQWSHDRAAWTVEAKFIVNDYGLRNRFAIITETPGQPTFEKRVYAQYAYITALLEYVAAHAAEMQAVVKAADDKTVADVLAGSENGTLTNFLDGKYESAGKIDLLAYPSNRPAYRPGTSVLGTRPGDASGPPEVVHDVDDLTKSVGTRTAWVPRGYLIPAEYPEIAAKLRAHNIKVTVLDAPRTVDGQEFGISAVTKVRRSGYDMTTLEGEFAKVSGRTFPAGTFYVDMAQPMANAAFYYLEPQARDGFVGWWVFDAIVKAGQPYPVFKVQRSAK